MTQPNPNDTKFEQQRSDSAKAALKARRKIIIQKTLKQPQSVLLITWKRRKINSFLSMNI